MQSWRSAFVARNYHRSGWRGWLAGLLARQIDPMMVMWRTMLVLVAVALVAAVLGEGVVAMGVMVGVLVLIWAVAWMAAGD